MLDIQTRQVKYDSVKKESEIVKKRAELDAKKMVLEQETELAIKQAELKMLNENESALSEGNLQAHDQQSDQQFYPAQPIYDINNSHKPMYEAYQPQEYN